MGDGRDSSVVVRVGDRRRWHPDADLGRKRNGHEFRVVEVDQTRHFAVRVTYLTGDALPNEHRLDWVAAHSELLSRAEPPAEAPVDDGSRVELGDVWRSKYGGDFEVRERDGYKFRLFSLKSTGNSWSTEEQIVLNMTLVRRAPAEQPAAEARGCKFCDSKCPTCCPNDESVYAKAEPPKPAPVEHRSCPRCHWATTGETCPHCMLPIEAKPAPPPDPRAAFHIAAERCPDGLDPRGWRASVAAYAEWSRHPGLGADEIVNRTVATLRNVRPNFPNVLRAAYNRAIAPAQTRGRSTAERSGRLNRAWWRR